MMIIRLRKELSSKVWTRAPKRLPRTGPDASRRSRAGRCRRSRYRNGLIADDGQDAVMARIQSGIRNGKTRPRAVPASNAQNHEPPKDDMPANDPSHRDHLDESKRSVIITSASKIKPARVRWLRRNLD